MPNQSDLIQAVEYISGDPTRPVGDLHQGAPNEVVRLFGALEVPVRSTLDATQVALGAALHALEPMLAPDSRPHSTRIVPGAEFHAYVSGGGAELPERPGYDAMRPVGARYRYSAVDVTFPGHEACMLLARHSEKPLELPDGATFRPVRIRGNLG